MKYEITINQALNLMAMMKTQRQEIRTNLRQEYSNEIISVNGNKYDNEKRTKTGIEQFEKIEALNKDLMTLINAVNKKNNEVLSNGKTLSEMINYVKIERMMYDIIKDTMREDSLKESFGNVIEYGCLIQDYLQEKLKGKSLEKIEMLSNEIDILNNEIKITVDLETVEL